MAEGFMALRKERRREMAYFVSVICQSNGANITAAELLGEQPEEREPGKREIARAKRLFKKHGVNINAGN